MRKGDDARGRFTRHCGLLDLFERSRGLFGDGYEAQFEVELTQDLVAELGPVSEARYERGPFTVAEFERSEDDYAYSRLPDEFMAEHLASIEKMGADKC